MKNLIFIITIMLLHVVTFNAAANEPLSDTNSSGIPTVGKETNLPLPRFVTIKAKNANIRNGPSNTYSIKWIYQRQGYPVQIISEFQNWRKIKDFDGEEGWIHEALISSKRNGLIIANLDGGNEVIIHRYPDHLGKPLARIQDGVLVTVKECNLGWCYINAENVAGWVAKENIWGVLKQEIVKR